MVVGALAPLLPPPTYCSNTVMTSPTVRARERAVMASSDTLTLSAADADDVSSTRLIESTPKSSSNDKSSVIMSSEKPVVADSNSRITLMTCAVDTPPAAAAAGRGAAAGTGVAGAGVVIGGRAVAA